MRAFELWFKGRYGFRPKKNEDGDYEDAIVRRMWARWQRLRG